MSFGPSDPTSSTQRHLRSAPVDVLKSTMSLYTRIGSATWVATIGCGLLGIWLRDWRWVATAFVVGLGWVTSHLVCDQIEAELRRRAELDADGCPDLVEGD